MKLWAELKRRRVFRVAGAYIIVAWLLVQVADIFFPALKLPDWSITLVAGLVILGFPIAILLAWAYQVTPEGVVREDDVPSTESASHPGSNRLSYLILGLLVTVVLLLLADRFFSGAPSPGLSQNTPVATTETSLAAVIPLPEHAPLAIGIADIGFDGPLLALSPDGRWLVYVGRVDSGSGLFLRDLGSFDQPRFITGTEDAIHAFFSPDGQSIGFVTNDKVKRVSLDGQEVQTIAAVNAPVRGRWLDEGTIFLVDGQANTIHRVDVDSGETEQLIYSDGHRFSDLLSDGKFALGVQFPPSIDGDQGNLQVISLEDESSVSLGIRGFAASNLGNGYLLYGRNGNLQIVEFNEETHEVSGQPQPVLSGVALDSIFYQAQVAASENGTLAFIPGADSGIGRIVRQPREGPPEVVTPEPMKYGVFDLGHDDRTLAIHVGDVTDYISIYDLQNQQGRKLPGSDGFGWPILARGGDIASSSLDQVARVIVRLGHVDRSMSEREIDLPGLRGTPSDFSMDGRMIFTEWSGGGRLALLPLSGTPKLEWVDGEAGDWGAVYSPDDQWFAYSSNQTGRYEIWIRPADGSGTPRQLSVGGGIEPVWCDCGEVIYRRGDEIWSTRVGIGDQPETGPETLAFTMIDFLDTPGRSFDVSSDGSTVFYVQLAEPAINNQIHVISNWQKLLQD